MITHASFFLSHLVRFYFMTPYLRVHNIEMVEKPVLVLLLFVLLSSCLSFRASSHAELIICCKQASLIIVSFSC